MGPTQNITILRAAQKYEGMAWVTYDNQLQQQALARKGLIWSTTDFRLYNEAFMGSAKSIPQSPHCLSENHVGLYCPISPNPLIVGWFPDTRQLATPQYAGFPINQPRNCNTAGDLSEL